MNITFNCPFCLTGTIIYNQYKASMYCIKCEYKATDKQFINSIVNQDLIFSFNRIKNEAIAKYVSDNCNKSKIARDVIIDLFKSIEQEYNQKRCTDTI